ncbi:MAG: hypothetical protein M1503_06240 [Thaumarchaeota archaeon]|nr:hypothetical protein [Nitrososphaerota archaeon]MCL5317842.1 hypothetical protein [Nitrososphaerota archaeon]
MSGKLRFRVKKVGVGDYRLSEVFMGLETSKVLQRIFGEELNEVLDETRVNINRHPWIIWVNEENGEININEDYLRENDAQTMRLDVVHELIHVKQLSDGKELFDSRFSYVDRPTEIEAYRLTVEEALNMGLSSEEIVDYLRVDWVTEEEHQRLVKAVM